MNRVGSGDTFVQYYRSSAIPCPFERLEFHKIIDMANAKPDISWQHKLAKALTGAASFENALGNDKTKFAAVSEVGIGGNKRQESGTF